MFPSFMEILNSTECAEPLSRVMVGRVAITVSSSPIILPVNFVAIDGRRFSRANRAPGLPQSRRELLSHSRSTRTSPTGAQVGA